MLRVKAIKSLGGFAGVGAENTDVTRRAAVGDTV